MLRFFRRHLTEVRSERRFRIPGVGVVEMRTNQYHGRRTAWVALDDQVRPVWRLVPHYLESALGECTRPAQARALLGLPAGQPSRGGAR